MKYRNSLPEIDSDNSAFVQYESMRSHALNKQETFCERSLGLTLLIRQGMLAWIEICHQCIPADPNPVKLTADEVASILAVTVATVRRWGKKGIIKTYSYNDRNGCLYEHPGVNSPLMRKRV